MFLTPFDDLLALAEPPIASEAVQAAEKDLAEAKDHIDVMALSAPDNKEELEEEQVDWCNRWHQALVCRQNFSLSPCLVTSMKE